MLSQYYVMNSNRNVELIQFKVNTQHSQQGDHTAKIRSSKCRSELVALCSELVTHGACGLRPHHGDIPPAVSVESTQDPHQQPTATAHRHHSIRRTRHIFGNLVHQCRVPIPRPATSHVLCNIACAVQHLMYSATSNEIPTHC
jgi:hypothetical protein